MEGPFVEIVTQATSLIDVGVMVDDGIVVTVHQGTANAIGGSLVVGMLID